ncbi:anti-sigma factor family protein [Alkalihalobacillus pseudalcaliphilus]|uniref:anti-sigma factor family protein n=1 Tax=Alkalihalobacillus pseudalcaliphilus TaxID=79884 RepID=UPI00064E113E|nr:hypothetical protein [Alkalihalobacillus pseudalcaliphilus]KMK75285.1 hypothetical protein AB990_17885 [Alkalihalobacillus pseudalcaliphilus]
MKEHFSKQEWQLYILGEYDETQESKMEDHLYTCDDCLSVYMDLLEQVDVGTTEPVSFVESIMTKVEPIAKAHQQLHMKSDMKTNELKSKKKKGASRKQTFLHYILAASLTFILMTSGIFEDIAEGAHQEQVEREVVMATKEPAVSERVLDKISQVFDQMINTERGKQHESE